MEPLDLNEYDIETAAVAAPEAEHNEPDQTQLDPDLGVQDLGVDDVVSAGPVRRTRPKLDADKLLNPHRGYPELLRSVRRIKYRGPGDETKYLRKYVMAYQIWANRLWPKANFDDFIVLARRAGRDPRVRQYCRSLIEDEKYGAVPRDASRESNDERRYSSGSARGRDLSAQSDARENIDDGRTLSINEGEPSVDAVDGHTTELHSRRNNPDGRDGVDGRGTSRSTDSAREDEYDPRVDIDAAHSPDRVHASFEPHDDELEAAMDLYADMGF